MSVPSNVPLMRYRTSSHGASVVVELVVDELVVDELVVDELVVEEVVLDVEVELVGGIVEPGGIDVVTTEPFDCAPAGAIDNT